GIDLAAPVQRVEVVGVGVDLGGQALDGGIVGERHLRWCRRLTGRRWLRRRRGLGWLSRLVLGCRRRWRRRRRWCWRDDRCFGLRWLRRRQIGLRRRGGRRRGRLGWRKRRGELAPPAPVTNEKSSDSEEEIQGICSWREARVTPTRVLFSVSSAIRSGTRISLSSSCTNRLWSPPLS